MSNKRAAILLAAGRSSRMGTCKQLLPLGEGTAMDCCLKTLITAGISEIVVVVAGDGEPVAQAARNFPVTIAINTQVEGDMASSVRTGRDTLSTGTEQVVVALCDCPLVLPATVTRLLDEQDQFPGSIIIPCYGGRRGHPLLVPLSVLNELKGDLTLRDLLTAEQDRIRCVEVDDHGVLYDMDTPEDYKRMQEMVHAQLKRGSVS